LWSLVSTAAFASHRSAFPTARISTLARVELGDLGGQSSVDFRGALREQLQQLVRDAGDLSLAVADVTELDPVTRREFGAQYRLVDATECSLVLLQEPGIQGQPAPVVGLHLARDHHVGVQLRVVQP
jgi:hypothetical protein